MKLARITRQSPDDTIPRLVIVQPEQQRVIDLACAERLRLERQGATHDAALRLATALFPSSMTAALALGDHFLAAAKQAIERVDEQATLPLSDALPHEKSSFVRFTHLFSSNSELVSPPRPQFRASALEQ